MVCKNSLSFRSRTRWGRADNRNNAGIIDEAPEMYFHRNSCFNLFGFLSQANVVCIVYALDDDSTIERVNNITLTAFCFLQHVSLLCLDNILLVAFASPMRARIQSSTSCSRRKQVWRHRSQQDAGASFGCTSFVILLLSYHTFLSLFCCCCSLQCQFLTSMKRQKHVLRWIKHLKSVWRCWVVTLMRLLLFCLVSARRARYKTSAKCSTTHRKLSCIQQLQFLSNTKEK